MYLNVRVCLCVYVHDSKSMNLSPLTIFIIKICKSITECEFLSEIIAISFVEGDNVLMVELLTQS